MQKCKHKRRKELEINNTEKYLGEAPCHKLELYYRYKNRDINDLYHAITKAHYVPCPEVILLGAKELTFTHLDFIMNFNPQV